MNKIFLIIALSFYSLISFGQEGWENIYNDKIANTFSYTLMKNYILAGSKYESMMQKWYVFQTDSVGIVKWDTTFLHGSEGKPECITATKDSGYIVAGYDNINPYLLKFNKNNKLQWESKINTNYGELSIKDVQVRDTTYLIIGGGKYSIDQGLFLANLNLIGDTIWTMLYKGFASGISIVESFDSGYYCLSNRGTLLKINSIGDTLWTKKTLDNFISNSMVKTIDGIVISGNGDGLIFLKVDKFGNQIWEKTYTSNYSYNNNVFISTTYDNGFITSNYMEPLRQNESNLWIMKLDENGDSLFSISSLIKLRSDKIMQTDDSLFVFLANDKYQRPRLIKTDSLGDVITTIHTTKLFDDQVYLYPNPFENELTIILTESIGQNGYLKIYSSSGLLMFEKNINNKTTINLSNLGKGLYILNLTTGNKMISKKIIKE